MIKSYLPAFAISQDIILPWPLALISRRIGWVENVPPVGAVSPSKVVIFNAESLDSVGISSRRAVSWFMRKIFEAESKRTFIACFRPLISINAFPSGQA